MFVTKPRNLMEPFGIFSNFLKFLRSLVNLGLGSFSELLSSSRSIFGALGLENIWSLVKRNAEFVND